MKKALVILLAVVLYFNVGYYFADRYMSVGLKQECSSLVDEITITGNDDCLLLKREADYDEVTFALIAILWPILLVVSIITWAWWLVFSGGLLEIMGTGTFFSITACLVLLVIGIYLMKKSKK